MLGYLLLSTLGTLFGTDTDSYFPLLKYQYTSDIQFIRTGIIILQTERIYYSSVLNRFFLLALN